MSFLTHRKQLIEEILKYSKIKREDLRVFETSTLVKMLEDLTKRVSGYKTKNN